MDILLIEDDPMVRDGLLEVLQMHHYQVTVASNGREGLEKLTDSPPQLVITDIIMPEKDGIEVILEIRKKHPKIKIIAISGGGRINAQDHLNVAEQLGVDETLTKPFVTAELLSKIEHLFTK